MAKDYTKYEVSGMDKAFNKSRLVQAIVKDYIAKNSPNWEALQTAFPDNIQGSNGVVAKKDADVKERDFYLNEPTTISGGTEIVICRQWGADNIAKFIEQAKTLGYAITAKSQTVEAKEMPAAEPQTMKEININISGRISNYMFGILGDEAYAECEKAMSYTIDDNIETIGEFVNMFYETTLEGDDGMENFQESIDMEQFKSNCPLLSEFLDKVEKGDASHLQFYEEILDMSWEEVNIIEDDASITITVDDEEVLPQQKLADFLGETELVDEDDDPKAVAIANAFWAKHREEFNIHEDIDEFTVYKAKNGVLQLNEWIEPERLKAYRTRERNITVEHDNIVDFDFFFEAADFDLSKLAFLQYGNATDFHDSGAEYVGSFLAYDNNIIPPYQNIHRDKGFTLFYEEGLKSCDFLIFG